VADGVGGGICHAAPCVQLSTIACNGQLHDAPGYH